MADPAAGGDDAAQHVVRDLDPAKVKPVLDPEEAPVHESRKRVRRRARRSESLAHAFLGDAFAEAGVGEHLVLNELADAVGLVGERPLVEFGKDRVAGARKEVRGNLLMALGQAGVVELPADEAQERGLHLGPCQVGSPGDEFDHGLGHRLAHQVGGGGPHRRDGLRPRHPRQAHAVLGHRWHLCLQALQVREVVLAQRDQDPVVGSCEVEARGIRLVALDPALKRRGRAVLDQVRQVREELLGAPPARIVGLREREDLLKLVEDQDGNEGAPARVLQDVVPVVQEFPERFPGDGGTGLGPRSGRLGRQHHRTLDLLGGGGRLRVVVEPDVDRAEPLGPEARDKPGLEDGGLAEARLPKEHRQELALHPPAELRGLLLAAMEVAAGLLGERDQAEPRILGVYGRDGRGAHACWEFRSSFRRWTNSREGSPPCRRAKWTALNFSGAMASASVVWSMHTGRMKTAPSAMPRVRSTA